MQLLITIAHYNIFMISHYSVIYILNFVICEHYWFHICEFIQDYINQCQECNWNKLIIHVIYDALTSLLISEKFWSHIEINFITDFSVTQHTHLNCILIVINVYIKMTHFVFIIMIIKILNIINLLWWHVIKHYKILKIIVFNKTNDDLIISESISVND
jgi:hypothetical protein